jgi:putative heme iron utilization protein
MLKESLFLLLDSLLEFISRKLTVLDLISIFMSEIITSTISDRICKHMNDDHSEAIVVYAKFFGNITTAESAQMLAIDSFGMDLKVETEKDTVPVRIEFARQLESAKDAHHILIEMLKEARS